MRITFLASLALLLAVGCASPGYRTNPSTIVNISPAVNQRIIVTYANEQDTATFAATLAAEMGDWFVEAVDGTPIALPATPGAFVITGGTSPVVTLDGKQIKVYSYKQNVLGTKRYAIGGDVPQKDTFYLVINYQTSVITIEVKQKG